MQPLSHTQPYALAFETIREKGAISLFTSRGEQYFVVDRNTYTVDKTFRTIMDALAKQEQLPALRYWTSGSFMLDDYDTGNSESKLQFPDNYKPVERTPEQRAQAVKDTEAKIREISKQFETDLIGQRPS